MFIVQFSHTPPALLFQPNGVHIPPAPGEKKERTPSMALARYPHPHAPYYAHYGPPPPHFHPGMHPGFAVPPPPPIPPSARPPVPPKDKQPRPTAGEEITYQTSVPLQPDRGPPLIKVRLPACAISRFVSIAAVDTAQNHGACGLLLGKRKNDRYYVTTLLIPRQKGTSTSCTVLEEDLVVGFQQERQLLALGSVSILFAVLSSELPHARRLTWHTLADPNTPVPNL